MEQGKNGQSPGIVLQSQLHVLSLHCLSTYYMCIKPVRTNENIITWQETEFLGKKVDGEILKAFNSF
jgi:hypothetical protein